MKLGGSLFIVFMLFASLGFAYTFPSCLTSYSILGVNFALSGSGTCASNIGLLQGAVASTTGYTANATNIKISKDTGNDISNLQFPISGNYSGTATASATQNKFIHCSAGNMEICGAGSINFTEINSTDYNISFSSLSLDCVKSSGWSVAFDTSGAGCGGGAGSYLDLPIWNTSATNQLTSATSGALINSTQYYIGGFVNSQLLYGDFKGGGNILTGGSSYCQALLYFNNPYYGNIQLIPKITYIPGTDAFASFYNATSNAAYLPNNTISYIYDSITNGWYIVPASICTSFTIVGSSSTLQYNPTGITPGSTGQIPIQISSINGTCAFNTATRVISCSGSDSSSTLTLLSLAAYQSGNSTAACSSSTAGSSGSLTCTLPNVNGTYNSYFYGTDINNLNYLIVSNSYTVGGNTQTTFGRDGFIAALLIVVVAAMLVTNSILVSMVLACFGLFVSIAFGIIPIETGAIAALFAVVALALAYRLKV